MCVIYIDPYPPIPRTHSCLPPSHWLINSTLKSSGIETNDDDREKSHLAKEKLIHGNNREYLQLQSSVTGLVEELTEEICAAR